MSPESTTEASLVFLYKENELNKILRKQASTKEDIRILFVSLWDKASAVLLDKLKNKTDNKTTYVVDSFNMPHAFVIFNTTKIPHLVLLGNKKSSSLDYLPTVYRVLGV